jgi:hypothetical protein
MYAGRLLPDDVISSVVVFFAFFFLCYSGLTILLMAMDLDFLTSTSAAVSALANVGPGLGPTIGPAGNFSTIPDPAKWLLALRCCSGDWSFYSAGAVLSTVLAGVSVCFDCVALATTTICNHAQDHRDAGRIGCRRNGRLPYLRLHHKAGELGVLSLAAFGAHLAAIDPWLWLHESTQTCALRIREAALEDGQQQRAVVAIKAVSGPYRQPPAPGQERSREAIGGFPR